ncbi:Na+ dependent nucleoside transporter, partial [Saprospiraceae bacterium]|nr:Na+ dependent nucleoside transporter [Saprospiraceae bacterium]
MFGGLVTDMASFGYIFAFQVLPTIVFFSALTSILYYLGILQKVVYGLAWALSKSMGLSGPESLAAAANVFIGQTEAPLVVKPYLENMTRSEIMCLMTGGMATIAGGVFAAYIGYLGGDDPVQQTFFAKHLLTASLISAPAAIVAAKMLVPETNKKDIDTQLKMTGDKAHNILDAISTGTTDGLKLAVNVGVMLLVFTALIALCNQLLMSTVGQIGGLNEWVTESTSNKFEGFNLTYILGVVFAPFAWLLGTPSEDVLLVGQLLGQKTAINEFVAYAELDNIRKAGMSLSPKSLIIATYALCGFANFASIGIQIGGIGAIAPGQRRTLTELGLLALLGGTIASFLTAAIAGVLV